MMTVHTEPELGSSAIGPWGALVAVLSAAELVLDMHLMRKFGGTLGPRLHPEEIVDGLTQGAIGRREDR